jgi:hypothetical protein
MLFLLMLKMDAAVQKHTLLSVQQHEAAQFIPGPSRAEWLSKYAKHYAANLHVYNCVTNFVRRKNGLELEDDLAVVAGLAKLNN